MDKIREIQKKLQEKELDAVLITDEKNQRYATGFAFTDGAVVVTREHAYLITDSRYVEAAEQAVTERTKVILFGQNRRLVPCIQEILQSEKIEKLGAEEEKLSYQEYLRYEKSLDLHLIPAQEIFQDLRASKSEDELEYMRAAQRISERALEDVLGLIRPGITEREIAAELNYRMMRYGAEGNSFDTISITGKKTSMPHGVPGDEVVRDGDFVTMDFGCLKGGYCSDMTRTVAVGHVTEEMRKIYDIVLEAQLQGIENARAGITGAEIDKAAREGDANAISFPKAHIKDAPLDFSFSGVKSAVLNYLNECHMKGIPVSQADVAASFQKVIVEVIVEHTMEAAKESGLNVVALAGGVASNSELRRQMEEACKKRGYRFCLPSPIYCTDNAVMIGAAGYYDYLNGKRAGWDLNAVPNLKLGA